MPRSGLNSDMSGRAALGISSWYLIEMVGKAKKQWGAKILEKDFNLHDPETRKHRILDLDILSEMQAAIGPGNVLILLGLLEAELGFLPKILSDLETDDDRYPLFKYLHALKGTAGSIFC